MVGGSGRCLDMDWRQYIKTMRLSQDGRHFADNIFQCIFLNENVSILIKISLNFVPRGPVNNIPALVQIMAWCWPGDKPLSESVMVSLLMHVCIIRPQFKVKAAQIDIEPGKRRIYYEVTYFKWCETCAEKMLINRLIKEILINDILKTYLDVLVNWILNKGTTCKTDFLNQILTGKLWCVSLV